jgi:aconitate hydratase
VKPDTRDIEKFYAGLPGKIELIRRILGHPLTLSEKILYSHLFDISSCAPIKRGSDYAEFAPDRLAMQDATAQMSLLQFMMTGKKKTAVPATVHCDHLITAENGADEDLRSALTRNREVYDFLSSVCRKYGIGFWKPGTGIIHQIILENYAFPGGMITGTDSHTPNAGGLGMIAIGTGGADAVDVMAGMGWETRFPQITGIRLTGRLNGWCSPKDIILKITGMLTVSGGTGHIIEYFGDGAESISCSGKATMCNMGAETGATCSLFGFDDSMKKYLESTGRRNISLMAGIVKEYLTGDPEVYSNPEKYFDRVFEIDLSAIEPYINGPFTPDIATPISAMKEKIPENGWPENVSVCLIGSCTNSSYEDISRAASVIRDALAKGASLKSELKVTPGSERIRQLVERDGYLELFRKAGAEIFANACGPCIGQWHRHGPGSDKINTIVHSFNRNFAKRADGNPDTHAFVASPEIAAAIAIAGKITFNPLTDTVLNTEGRKINLKVPVTAEMPAVKLNPGEYGFPETAESDPDVTVIINSSSERLQLPDPFPVWDGSDMKGLLLLIKSKGKCTTDHISMAGEWLKFRGHLENISGNYMTGAINSFNNQANLVLNRIENKYGPVPETAKAYRNAGQGSIVVGEENFGEGSSREHAALEPRFLGVKAILVKSFARIHEANLKKQGILALTFADKTDYDKIKEDDVIDITGLKEFSPGRTFTLILKHSDGAEEKLQACHSYNKTQIEWFRAGSALNLIRQSEKK